MLDVEDSSVGTLVDLSKRNQDESRRLKDIYKKKASNGSETHPEVVMQIQEEESK